MWFPRQLVRRRRSKRPHSGNRPASCRYWKDISILTVYRCQYTRMVSEVPMKSSTLHHTVCTQYRVLWQPLPLPVSNHRSLLAAFSITLLAMASHSSLETWNISLEGQMEKIPASPEVLHNYSRFGLFKLSYKIEYSYSEPCIFSKHHMSL